MTVDRDKRWEEIQAISRRVASNPGIPTEIEAALCGAVVRARDWLEELQATKELFAASSARSETEASNDTFRLDWLHDQLKLTVADAFQWPVIPQDKVSWRAKIDEEIHNKQAEEDALG